MLRDQQRNLDRRDIPALCAQYRSPSLNDFITGRDARAEA
jgi:hypothetical protein